MTFYTELEVVKFKLQQHNQYIAEFRFVNRYSNHAVTLLN